MGPGIPPLRIENLLEPDPVKSRFLSSQTGRKTDHEVEVAPIAQLA